jgi:hypothetical protein
MKFNSVIISLIVLAIVTAGILLLPGCKKGNENPPLGYVNISIQPNSTIYQELNIIGGWRYLDESDGVFPPSRGLIVYRSTTDQFMAYDRTPPYKPDSCCNANNQCTKLIVGDEYPFVVDTCTGSRYLIIDGSPSQGPSNTFLYTYITEYDGYTLYIHN